MKKFQLTESPFLESNAIIYQGDMFDIGTRVITWKQKGGFNAYDTSKVVVKDKTGAVVKTISGTRYSKRNVAKIKQFFIHHSGGDGPNPKTMFETLHNNRKLSVHFACEDTGVIYQFLDCQECAWHAGANNAVSIGVEGALYPSYKEFPDYYSPERCQKFGNLSHKVVEDTIHGKKMQVFTFTDIQVQSLAKLAAGCWWAVFRGTQPAPTFYKDENGEIPRTVIPNPQTWTGLIGHLQTTIQKIDPAGFPWEYFESIVAKNYSEFCTKAQEIC